MTKQTIKAAVGYCYTCSSIYKGKQNVFLDKCTLDFKTSFFRLHQQIRRKKYSITWILFFFSYSLADSLVNNLTDVGCLFAILALQSKS